MHIFFPVQSSTINLPLYSLFVLQIAVLSRIKHNLTILLAVGVLRNIEEKLFATFPGTCFSTRVVCAIRMTDLPYHGPVK